MFNTAVFDTSWHQTNEDSIIFYSRPYRIAHMYLEFFLIQNGWKLSLFSYKILNDMFKTGGVHYSQTTGDICQSLGLNGIFYLRILLWYNHFVVFQQNSRELIHPLTFKGFNNLQNLVFIWPIHWHATRWRCLSTKCIRDLDSIQDSTLVKGGRSIFSGHFWALLKRVVISTVIFTGLV